MANNGLKAFKSGAWYMVANFLIAGSSFLTTPIFTRILSQEQYGLFNNFTSWQSILAILFTFNVAASLISARYDYENDLDKYIFSVLNLSAVSVLVWTIILNLFSDWAQRFFSLDIRYLNLMMAYIFFLRVFEMFQIKQRYFFQYRLQVSLSILSALSSLALALFLVTHMEDRLSGRIYGYTLPTIALGAGIYLYFFAKGRGLRLDYWRYALKICLPYIPHLLSMTVLASTDRIMITKICGSRDTALYSLAYTCGALMGILVDSVNTAFSPWLAERLHVNDVKSVRGFSKYYISAFACVSFGAMLVAPEILYVLGGKRYLAAIYVMPPVAMGCLCQFLYTMFVNIEQIKRKTVGMAAASAAAALMNYILNLLFIPRFGYIAAAYTTLAGYLLLLALHMLLVRRMGMADVYSYPFVICTVLVAGVVMMIVNAAYSTTAVRYILVLCYLSALLAFAVKKRKMIVDLVRLVMSKQ